MLTNRQDQQLCIFTCKTMRQIYEPMNNYYESWKTNELYTRSNKIHEKQKIVQRMETIKSIIRYWKSQRKIIIKMVPWCGRSK